MSKYKVGDKVRIVSEWGEGCDQNPDGYMDKWLGKIMTIRKLSKNCGKLAYEMKEDREENRGFGWCWNEKCIAGLANKFNVGERYKVGDESLLEAGNIIEITCVDSDRVYYKTIIAVDGGKVRDGFDARSAFAKNLIPYAEENEKIIIIRDGQKVTARKYVNEQLVDSAVARCAPEDTFDFDIGARIAVNRLLNIKEVSQDEQTNMFDGLTFEQATEIIDKMTKLVDKLVTLK